MNVLLLLALTTTQATVPGPLPGIAAGGQEKPRPTASGELAFEVPLPAKPVAPPLRLATGDSGTLVLLPLADRLEARRTTDGSLAWSRTDLAGSGLATTAPSTDAGVPVLGWAGPARDGARFVILRATDGGTVAEAPLATRPSGPPTRLKPAGSNAFSWIVPLENGQFAAFDVNGRPTGGYTIDAPVTRPLIAFDGKALAVAGPDNHLVTLGSPSRATARDIEPRTAVVSDDGEYLYAAGARSFARWRCKPRPSGAIACRQKWRQPLGGAVSAPPLVSPERVIVGSWDTHVYAFAPRSGHLLWRTHAGQRFETPVIPWDDERIAVMAESTARVLFFDAATGHPAGSVAAGPNDVFVGGIVRAADLLFVVTLPDPAFAPALRAYRVVLKVVTPRKGPPGAQPGVEHGQPSDPNALGRPSGADQPVNPGPEQQPSTKNPDAPTPPPPS